MKKIILYLILTANLAPAFGQNIGMRQSLEKKYIRVQHSTVKLATYNLGMLNTELAKVPLYKDRLENLEPLLSQYLETEKPSVLFLQEVWHGNSNIKIQIAAENTGYIPVIEINDRLKNSILFENNHGLQILISPKLLAQARNYSSGFKPLRQGESYICGFGLICKRGYAYAKLERDNTTMIFVTFHLTPLISEITKRRLEITEIIKQLQNEKADYIIIGADFNYSPEFGETVKQNDSRIWIENGKLYEEWLRLWQKAGYTCKDHWKETNPENKGYTQNREKNSIAAQGHSTRMEPSQRIDQIWTCGKSLTAIEVSEAHLIFTEKLNRNANEKYELSDHYGLQSEINIYSFSGIYSSLNPCLSEEKTCFVYEKK